MKNIKILVINGSPKGERSNTLKLTNAFLEGICAAGQAEIQRLTVSKMDIRSCSGCFSCWKDTPGLCCIHDDMQLVLEKLLWADLTIWSFPLYYFSLPGKLKTVIDRQLPLTLPFMSSDAEGGGHRTRYDMSQKKNVLISTCGFYTAKTNYDSVTAQFDRLYGKGNYCALFCGEGELFRVPKLAARTDEYLAVVRQAGTEYICGGIRQETTEKLQELLFPRDVFERMADASWGVSDTGEKEDSSLTFTKQMAALYNPAMYSGTDFTFDMDYTDIGKRYRVILGKTNSRVAEQFDGEPNTVIHTPFSVWQSIAAGEIGGSEALMKHLYSVEGDFRLMLRWDDYFGQNHEGTQTKKEPAVAKTNMGCLLTPWIVFWVAAGIHAFGGSILSIFSCSLLPLLFYKNKKTIYDVISAAAVSAFSLLLLLHLPAVLVMPLSYLAYGVMWSLSAFGKIPLTAEYSMNHYGGEKAFQNPLFLQTNRILTAAWGILYLLTSIVSFFLMRTAAGSYIGIINSVLPAVMGIFTAWFQKWYPRRIARGA